MGGSGMSLALYGYRYSVYSWIARFAFAEKGVSYEWIETDPFASDIPSSYLAVHPFKRVPALVHEGFALYETTAITRYVDEAFDGPRLQPSAPRARARCNQIISVIDSYAYWPLVRQVFSHGVFRQRLGLPVDPAEIDKGLASAHPVIDALEALASGETFLCGDAISLADIHLAPVIDYFCRLPEGKEVIAARPTLSQWRTQSAERPGFISTTPPLPKPTAIGNNKGTVS